MVKKAVLDRFVKLGGYETVKRKRNRKWKNVSLASKKTGLSRPTIYAILEEYPEPPSKTKPKYVEEFEDSEGYRLFKQRYKHNRNFEPHCTAITKAWLILNKKDPVSWTRDDWSKIWNHEKFVNEEIGGVPEHYATAFHNLMRALSAYGQTQFLLEFKGKKFPKGKKREWFLEEEDVIALLSQLDCNETLVMLGLGIVKGARFSALVQGTPNNLNAKDSVMLDYEPKRKQYLTRYIPRPIMKLLLDYIKDYKIEPSQKLFNQSYSYYMTKFGEAGERAGIKKTISTHIMKHTFVTQASRHGVSAEIICEQTGTELRTLTAHYRAKNPEKARHEILGEKTTAIPFSEWILALEPHFRENYERIKTYEGIETEQPIMVAQ